MIQFTDVHQHILYGVDDGPKDAKAMFAMLDRAHADQIKRIIATPHILPGLKPYKCDHVLRALKEAAQYCESKDYDIRLYEGGEIFYTDSAVRMLDDGVIPTMAQTQYVLTEFSTDITYRKLYDAVYKLLSHGYSPIVAHVERYQCLTRHIGNAYELKDKLDVFYQMNCATVVTGGGLLDQRFINSMLRHAQIDIVGTDAHNITTRPVCMRAAYTALKKHCDTEYARQLTQGGLIFEEFD